MTSHISQYSRQAACAELASPSHNYTHAVMEASYDRVQTLVLYFVFNNNNNNNSKTMFMVLSLWQSHCKSSPVLFHECRMVPTGCRPKTKPDDLGCESACAGCQSLHPPLPFIVIIQPESWYSFYRPTEVEGRVDLVGCWLHTEMVYPPTDGHPSDVAQLRWSRPTRYH